jgi:hypothetical protein
VDQKQIELLAALAASDDCEWVSANPEAAVKLFASAVANRPRPVLEFVRTVSFSSVSEFVAKHAFVEGQVVDGIKIVRIGENFKKHFLDKVERSVPALDLREHALAARARDATIVAELGEDQAETFLAHFWASLKTADHRLRQVRYIRGLDGSIWSVNCYWRDGGLDIEASTVTRPEEWSVDSCHTHIVSL